MPLQLLRTRWQLLLLAAALQMQQLAWAAQLQERSRAGWVVNSPPTPCCWVTMMSMGS
jgi:hypothetical protein